MNIKYKFYNVNEIFNAKMCVFCNNEGSKFLKKENFT